jgi:Holliday junction resolvase RusA-like endonuclease
MMPNRKIDFFVRGKAATAGSKRGFAIRKGGTYTGRVAMIGSDPREKDWKATVAAWAISAMKKANINGPLSSPINLEITFYLQRPKFHLNSAGKVKPQFSDLHTTKPDVTKLLRCLEDALREIVWRDDSQVCTTTVRKRYGAIPGAQVTIQEETSESQPFIHVLAGDQAQQRLPI